MRNRLSYAFLGLAIGWLVGLSVSPVIGAVLGSLLGIVAAIFGPARSGAEERATAIGTSDGHTAPPEWRLLGAHLSVATLACLVVGMAVGAPAGIYVRESGWLGPSLLARAKQQANADLEYQRLVIRFWAAETHRPESAIAEQVMRDTTGAKRPVAPTEIKAGLFGQFRTYCETLERTPSARLRGEMANTEGAFRDLANATSDSTLLRAVVEATCGSGR